MKLLLLTLVLYIIVCLTGCISAKIPNYHFNQKTAAPQLQQDVILLKKILEANHPSLYWYTPKDSIDAAFSQALNSITDSLTEVQFRNKIAYVINKIMCGHTAVRFSKNYSKVLDKNRYPAFPLAIKTWGDSMVVIGSLLAQDSIFKRGTIITSINKVSNQQLLDSMFSLLSTDGYSNNFKSQVFSGNFSGWFKLAFGVDSNYTIGYIDGIGKPQTATITNYLPKKDTTFKKKDSANIKPVAPPTKVKKPSKHQLKKIQLLAKRSLIIDTSISTAFLRVTTFSSGKLRTFFRRSFKTIHEKNIQNVVVDVRENTGGKIESSNLLTKYFIAKPFKTGDTVAAITQNIHYKKYIPQSYLYWPLMQVFSRKMADNKFHLRHEEKHIFKPKQHNHFNGQVYVLQAGLSFSAATLFIGNLQGQKNVIVLGEETGGGFYGNSAIFLPTVVLPNSKLRLVLPLYKLVINNTRIKTGHGILPDVLIEPTSNALKMGVDLKLVTTKQLIIKKMALSSTPN